jgi:RimJ/RimL family protein N-acetyltransferase
MASIEPIAIRLRDGAGLLVRTPTESDARELMEYRVRECATTDQVLTQPHECPKTPQEQWESMRDAVTSPDKLFLVGCIGGDIVGLLGFAAGHRERNRHQGVLGITIAETWRGRGVGTAMMRVLLDWARADPHIEKVNLSVFSTNTDAYRLYRRLGFEEEGRLLGNIQITPGYYVDEIQMRLWVKPRRAP